MVQPPLRLAETVWRNRIPAAPKAACGYLAPCSPNSAASRAIKSVFPSKMRSFGLRPSSCIFSVCKNSNLPQSVVSKFLSTSPRVLLDSVCLVLPSLHASWPVGKNRLPRTCHGAFALRLGQAHQTPATTRQILWVSEIEPTIDVHPPSLLPTPPQ